MSQQFTYGWGMNVPDVHHRRSSLAGFYSVWVNMVPSYHDRFLYMHQQPPYLRNPNYYFNRGETVTIVFDPVGGLPFFDDHYYHQDINQTLASYQLPRGITGEVHLHLTTNSVAYGNIPLGGLASFSYRFYDRPEVDLEAFLELMEERNYRHFSFHNVQVHVEISVIDFLLAGIHGGADGLSQLKKLPRAKYMLALYDFWGTGTKSQFNKAYTKLMPKHIKDVRGLLTYPWKPEWRRLCGAMAMVYGKAMTDCHRLIETEWIKKNNRDTFWHPSDEFMYECRLHPDIRRCLDFVTSLEDPEVLYNETVRQFREKDIPEGLDFTSLYQLTELQYRLCPDVTLVVVDQSRHVLYRHTGPQALLQDPPASKYKSGDLSYRVIQPFRLNRVTVFYDHVLQHFIPIFSLTLFYSRRKMEVDVEMIERDMEALAIVEDPSIADGTESRANEPIEGEEPTPRGIYRITYTRERPMTFCPFCDSSIVCGREGTHGCKVLRCFLCDETFTNSKDRIEHMRPELKAKTRPCRRCRQVCYGPECSRGHKALCNGVVKITCGTCFAHILSSRRNEHRCQRYFCHNCQCRQLNRVVYDNPDHPNGYVLYHPCAMPGKGRLSEEEAGLNDIGEDTKFFAFDFESALSKDEFNGFEIHVHTVNCASSAPIFPEASAEITRLVQEGIVTQWNMDDFFKHICAVSTGNTNYWIAHNFKGYDGRLFLDYVLSVGIVPKGMIMMGGKLMQLELTHPDDAQKRIIMQDSLNHIATSLQAMPKMFGLNTSLVKKGYFPYRFNTPENRGYKGPIPPLEYFEVEKKADPDDFYLWYHDASTYPYDLNKEMKAYCENDVLILSLSLSAYASICLQYSGVNPLPFLTIAQFTFQHYRMKYLPDNQVYYLDESFDTFARRALHGGNTNVRRLLYECSPEEAGTLQSGSKGCRYIDIQSLYPTVQFYDPMPVGYPRMIRYYSLESQPSPHKLATFFGFIECDIQPKEFMFHPLIGRFHQQKLYMDLHPHKRCVLTSPEFQMAISERGGYECTRVYRIDEYEKSTDLFRPFIQNWLKLKIISSNPPTQSADEPAFAVYAHELERRTGISVTWDEFKPNPSLRTLAKLVLNSLWGKFGQRSNLVECQVMRTANDVYKFHSERQMGLVTPKDSRPLGEVAYMQRFVRNKKWNKKNVAIAAFVTAQARLRLWDILEQLDDRVLYHDTDSVIYERRSEQDWMVPEGNFLGDWESETGDRMIHAFVGLAPKTYAYRYMKEDGTVVECVKSKGFSLSQQTKQFLNFDNYKDILLNAKRRHDEGEEIEQRKIEVPSLFFRHQPEAGATFTHDGAKVLAFDYKKGFVDFETWLTFPFGSSKWLVRPVFDTNEDPLMGEPNTRRRQRPSRCEDEGFEMLVDICNE